MDLDSNDLHDLSTVQGRIFDAYLQLQHVQRAERGRTQRWLCSWLYKLRACDDAETQQLHPGQRTSPARCRRIMPPNGPHELGWRGVNVSATADLGPLLFRFRCW